MRGALWLIPNLLGTLLFAYFAWLQREDDNPEIYSNPSVADVWTWIAFYGMVSLLFLLAAARKFPGWLLAVAAAFGVFEMAATGPGVWRNVAGGGFTMTKEAMNPGHAEVEQSREFFGAALALAGVGFLAWQGRRRRDAGPEGAA
jgi:hypothetical protein